MARPYVPGDRVVYIGTTVEVASVQRSERVDRMRVRLDNGIELHGNAASIREKIPHAEDAS